MKEIVIKDDLLEKLAAYDHDLWREYKISQGYHLHKDCPFINQPRCAKCNDLLVSFGELQESVKEINRLRWREIPKVLALNGLLIVDKEELNRELAGREIKTPEIKEDVKQ